VPAKRRSEALCSGDSGVVQLVVTHGLMSGNASAHSVARVVTSIGTAVTMPLTSAAELAIYFDLKLRLEGGDLAARVEAACAG
jgi:hypothetical protein